jgi:hypothetical protein
MVAIWTDEVTTAIEGFVGLTLDYLAGTIYSDWSGVIATGITTIWYASAASGTGRVGGIAIAGGFIGGGFSDEGDDFID